MGFMRDSAYPNNLSKLEMVKITNSRSRAANESDFEHYNKKIIELKEELEKLKIKRNDAFNKLSRWI